MSGLKNLRIATKVNVLVSCAVAVLVLLLWVTGVRMERSIHEARISTARAAADVGYEVARFYLEEYHAGRMTREEAQSRALNHLKSLRYENAEYYWVNNSALPYPTMIMHPVDPALDGQVLDNPQYNVAMGREQNLFQAFAEVCRRDGEGFVDYRWPRPGETTPVPKMSYVKHLVEWDWIIGTGVYVDTVVEDVRRVTIPISIMVGITVVSLLLVSFVVSARFIGRPIATLTRAAARLEQGDFSANVTSVCGDEIGCLAATFNVMTEELARRRAALETERNRLAGIIEGTRSGTWEWNVQTGEIVSNERFAEIIGYTLREISPVNIETWKQYAHPDDVKRSDDLFEMHFAGQTEFYECEARMKHKSGAWIWVLDRGKIMTWTEDGKPLVVMGTRQDITERKRAEEALRQSEDRLGLAMAVKNEGMWDWNLATNKTYFDERYYTMAGYADNEFPQTFEGWAAHVHPDDLPGADAAIKAHLSGESERFDIEFRWKRKDGSWMWIQGRGKIVERDESGAPLRMIGTHTDITERKRLENTNESLLNIIKKSQDFIGIAGKEGNAFFVNPAGQAMVGLDGDDAVRRTTVEEYFLEEDLPYLKEKILPVLFAEGRWNGEFRFRHFKTGEAIPVLYDLYLTEDPEKGQLTNITTISRDITERKRAEEVLRNERAQLLSVFNSIDQAIYIADTETYEILYVNQYLARMLPGNCIGAKCYRALQGLDAPCSFCTNDLILKQKPEPHRWEYYNPKFGRYYDIVDRIIRWPDGRDVRFEMAIDITEAKRTEAVIAAKNKELEQIVYVASHDLRSPLVNVAGFSRELDYSIRDLTGLLDGGKTEEELEKALRNEFPVMEKSIDRIRASASQMDKLLNGLLHLSRQSRSSLQFDNIEMNRCLAQLASSFAFAIREKGVELAVARLPACRGDAVQVTQVFANLIDNAIKYRDPGRPLKIQIRGSMEAGRAVYRVEDNGVGIAENHLEHVFELFHRLEPDKTEGEGLGLTIVRQALSRMYGEISVESELGRGSVFVVSMPPAHGWNEHG